MKCLALAALLATSTAAFAVGEAPWYPEKFYAGGAIGTSHLNVSGTDITGLANAQIDSSSTTYSMHAGWRFHPNASVEIGYYDLGKYPFHGSGAVAVDGTARAKSAGVSLVGYIPWQPFDFYGRVGYARSELKVNASGNLTNTPVNAKDNQNEATYGVGVRWNTDRYFGVFAEWMKNDRIKVDGYFLGGDFRF